MRMREEREGKLQSKCWDEGLRGRDNEERDSEGMDEEMKN